MHSIIDIVQSVCHSTAMGVSDGFVLPSDDKASQAWIIHAANGSTIQGKGPVDGTTEARTSHRTEVPGHAALFLMLSLLVKYCHIVGGKIATYCDNQAVVKKIQKGWRMW